VAYGLTGSLRGGRLASGRSGGRHRFRAIAVFGLYIAGGWLLPGRKRVVPYSIQTLKRLQPELFRQDLVTELAYAAKYVLSLIPAPIRGGDVQTNWVYVPSTRLGGDSLGYHWIDDTHFAWYLLDVSGHGVGLALLSVSVLNTLRNQCLPDVDFRCPDQVLAAVS